MRRSVTMSFFVAAFLPAATAAGFAQEARPQSMPPKTDQEMISNAMSAAPRAVAEKASIVAMDEKGQMRTLRQGSGNFTCMPDNPTTPGNDPMCLDKNGMAWADAWMNKKEPPKGKIGFGYMLQGGSDASNTDPHATAPTAGQKWVDTGPHVMIFNAPEMLQDYPTQATDTKAPYVMWSGTPYAHMMIPIGEPMQATAELPNSQPGGTPAR